MEPAQLRQAGLEAGSLAHEVVGECVAADPRRSRLDEDPRRDGLVEGGDQLLLGAGHEGGQDVEVDLGAQHSGRREHEPRVFRQRGQPPQQHLAHPRWEADATLVGERPGLTGELPGDLHREVGVAAGVPPHVVRERGRGVRCHALQQRGDGVLVEGPQAQSLDERSEARVAEQLGERRVPAPWGVAVAEHHEDAGGQTPHHVLEQQGARSVEPLGVLDDEEDRSAGGQPGDVGEGGVVQRGGAGAGQWRWRGVLRVHQERECGADPLGQGGEHPGDVGNTAQGLGDRLVRRLAVRAASHQHRGTGRRRLPCELGDQPRLADPGVAREQDDPPSAVQHVVPPRAELLRLTVAADERLQAGGGQDGVDGPRAVVARRAERLGRRSGVAEQGGVLLEDREAELLQLRAGIEAELVDKPIARRCERRERVRLPS